MYKEKEIVWIEVELSNGKRILVNAEVDESIFEGAEYEVTDRPEFIVKSGRVAVCGGY